MDEGVGAGSHLAAFFPFAVVFLLTVVNERQGELGWYSPARLFLVFSPCRSSVIGGCGLAFTVPSAADVACLRMLPVVNTVNGGGELLRESPLLVVDGGLVLGNKHSHLANSLL